MNPLRRLIILILILCYLYSLIMMEYYLNPIAPELNSQCDLLNEDSLREAVART